MAKLNGYLEDYTHLVDGLIELYQTTFEPRWYQAADALAQTMLDRYGAQGGGSFGDTSDDHEDLITRPRELQDNATPSGNAMAAWVLLRLGAPVVAYQENVSKIGLKWALPRSWFHGTI